MKRSCCGAWSLLFLLSLWSFLSAGTDAPAAGTTRRLALLVGVNGGGAARERLRYSLSDARSVLQVFEELGGVTADDSRLLAEPDRETLIWELRRLRERVARVHGAGERVEVVVYYSGHADSRAFLLGREKLVFKEFQEAVDALQAERCITIIDACSSGSFIRPKGSRKAQPFLFDQSMTMTGHAVITSSSADETSQESDQIRGSFFTHYFLSGLRGAADADRDGRITLSEIYRHVFAETLAGTAFLLGKPQHPNYNIEMSGSGEVVLTDLRQGDSRLRFSADLAGTLFIQRNNGACLTEIRKRSGQAMEIALGGGSWQVIHLEGEALREARVEVPAGGSVTVGPGAFVPLTRQSARQRGTLFQEMVAPQLSRLHLYAGLGTKIGLFEKEGYLMSGIQLGVRNSYWAFSLCGYNRSYRDGKGHPPYWGVLAERRLFQSGSVSFLGALHAGCGYRDVIDGKTQTPSSRFFWMVEPGLGATLSLAPMIRMAARVGATLPVGEFRHLSGYCWHVGVLLGGDGENRRSER